MIGHIYIQHPTCVDCGCCWFCAFKKEDHTEIVQLPTTPCTSLYNKPVQNSDLFTENEQPETLNNVGKCGVC